MIAPVGTSVHAVDFGVVDIEDGKRGFYHGTTSLAVRHQAGYVVRYCEIAKVAAGIRMGVMVRPGQVIAYVGRMHVNSMLHFELYAGNKAGPLTNRTNQPFQRRLDLLDPTSLLDMFACGLPGDVGVGQTINESERGVGSRMGTGIIT